MNPLVIEWIEKAEGDLAVAQREFTLGTSGNFDAVCFHAQQSAEKYMKAVLFYKEIDFPRTHSLHALLPLFNPPDRLLEAMRRELIDLSAKAVEVRYPGTKSTADGAAAALSTAEKVKLICSQQLSCDEAT